jgi:hypothetical protein
MHLVLAGAQERGVRTTYQLTACAASYYPKRAGRDAIVDGNPTEFKITGSRNYATPGTAGNNAYLQLDGVTYWISFDANFAAATEDLEFTTAEGKAPDANPTREPKNPQGEIDRRKNLSAALRAKFSTSKDAADDLEENLGENNAENNEAVGA